MKSFIAMLALVGMGLSAQAQTNNYFEIKKVTVKEISNDELPAIDMAAYATNFADCTTEASRLGNGEAVVAPAPGHELDPIEQIGVYVDEIINVGKKIWAVIDSGRPVVNVKLDTANAMPKGIQCWSQLTNWKPTESKAYQISYQNGFGMTVVDFAFRVLYTAGGSYKGQGQYLANATIVPARMYVAWGFTFNASSEVPLVFNQGTKDDPIAGMQLNMKWSVDTVMNHVEQTESFFVGGDGAFKHLN